MYCRKDKGVRAQRGIWLGLTLSLLWHLPASSLTFWPHTLCCSFFESLASVNFGFVLLTVPFGWTMLKPVINHTTNTITMGNSPSASDLVGGLGVISQESWSVLGSLMSKAYFAYSGQRAYELDCDLRVYSWTKEVICWGHSSWRCPRGWISVDDSWGWTLAWVSEGWFAYSSILFFSGWSKPWTLSFLLIHIISISYISLY